MLGHSNARRFRLIERDADRPDGGVNVKILPVYRISVLKPRDRVARPLRILSLLARYVDFAANPPRFRVDVWHSLFRRIRNRDVALLANSQVSRNGIKLTPTPIFKPANLT